MEHFKIRPMSKEDIPLIREFTDLAIGSGYYSLQEIEEIYKKSITASGKMMTLILLLENKIHGVRITYPPGNWQSGKGKSGKNKGLTTELWPHPLSETAYFQSLFVDPQLTGQGFGKKLSERALEMLKKIGAKGVVCHSWKESPHDSSGKYLRGMGFQLIATHPFYWKDVDYICTRCGKPCQCTAEEMYKELT